LDKTEKAIIQRVLEHRNNKEKAEIIRFYGNEILF
jgi:hypothetical protein